MSPQIVPVDPFDDEDVEAWHGVYAASEYADRGPDADVWQLEEQRQELRQVSDHVRRAAWLVRDADGTAVAAAWLALTLRDNTHLARCGIFVLPRVRRRGLGTRLLDLVESHARAEGRSVLVAFTHWPFAAGADGGGAAGVAFGRRRGFDLALGEVRRSLRLPVALPALPHEASAYTIRAFAGPIPPDLVEGWAVLDAAIETEAPTGELDLEPRPAAVAQVRETEALVAAQGRTMINAVAVTADGEVAAYSQMAVPPLEPVAYQWGTMVHRRHRGHRLGMAVKVAALDLLQRDHPRIAVVCTYNAEVNRHMIAVNEALGFEPVERLGQLQKRL